MANGIVYIAELQKADSNLYIRLIFQNNVFSC